jgi:uncharacterized protein involved in type VI secretion and phage assembly
MTPELDLDALLRGRLQTMGDPEAARDKVYGVTLGEVTNIDDPKGLGRVQVKLPWLSSHVDSAWAPIVSPWAGSGRGAELLPEVGDDALVAFQHGDTENPYVLGFLWSETTPLPTPTALGSSELRSSTGHRVVFDDLVGSARLTVQSGGGHQIVLDDTAGAMKISITDSKGMLSLIIDATAGKISITSKAAGIEIDGGAGQISLKAAAIDIHASGALSLKGDGAVEINGGVVQIN